MFSLSIERRNVLKPSLLSSIQQHRSFCSVARMRIEQTGIVPFCSLNSENLAELPRDSLLLLPPLPVNLVNRAIDKSTTAVVTYLSDGHFLY